METVAHVTITWKRQKGLLPVLLFLFSGWFAFDGLVGYPRSNERYQLWESIADDAERKAAFAKNGFEYKKPEKFFGPEKMVEQLVVAGIFAALGAWSLAYYLSQRKRFIGMHEARILLPGGVEVPFENVVGIGLKNWDSKGLATIRYRADGREKRLIADDYKFEAEPMHAIVKQLIAHLEARAGTSSEAPSETGR
jgi:hypothetical protein